MTRRLPLKASCPAQQLAGELLWVSQRSRPDVSYASTLASSLSTRAPLRSARISQRAFLYLRDTSQWELRFIPGESVLTGYGDASFSPEGGRSHTGWTVLFRNCPIAWRSSRQTLTTLSTAEAEMIALQEAALALMATEALLESLGIFPEDKLIYSDSTSAVAIQKGSCSFRTRHLKVRATWLREQIQNGSFVCGTSLVLCSSQTCSLRHCLIPGLGNLRSFGPCWTPQQPHKG